MGMLIYNDWYPFGMSVLSQGNLTGTWGQGTLIEDVEPLAISSC